MRTSLNHHRKTAGARVAASAGAGRQGWRHPVHGHHHDPAPSSPRSGPRNPEGAGRYAAWRRRAGPRRPRPGPGPAFASASTAHSSCRAGPQARIRSRTCWRRGTGTRGYRTAGRPRWPGVRGGGIRGEQRREDLRALAGAAWSACRACRKRSCPRPRRPARRPGRGSLWPRRPAARIRAGLGEGQPRSPAAWMASAAWARNSASRSRMATMALYRGSRLGLPACAFAWSHI